MKIVSCGEKNRQWNQKQMREVPTSKTGRATFILLMHHWVIVLSVFPPTPLVSGHHCILGAAAEHITQRHAMSSSACPPGCEHHAVGLCVPAAQRVELEISSLSITGAGTSSIALNSLHYAHDYVTRINLIK